MSELPASFDRWLTTDPRMEVEQVKCQECEGVGYDADDHEPGTEPAWCKECGGGGEVPADTYEPDEPDWDRIRDERGF